MNTRKACHFFLKGCCRNGPQCRFFHPSPTNPSRDVRDPKPNAKPKLPKVTKTQDGWCHKEFSKRTSNANRPSSMHAAVAKNPFSLFSGEKPVKLPMTRNKSWFEMMEEEEMNMTPDELYDRAVWQENILSRYR